ncbi:MAG: hypothetical protein AB7O53_10370, partial [Thermoleophilia bacterium]
MSAREPAHEPLVDRLPEAPGAAPSPAGPAALPFLGVAAAVGNRSLARAVATGSVPRGVIARAPTVTPAPLTIAMDRELSEGDKARLRTMAVARLRGAVTDLQSPKKSDIPRIARHLKPLPAIIGGFAADGETGATLQRVASNVSLAVQAISSAAGTMKPAIFRAVAKWQSAQRHLGAARSAIQGEMNVLNRKKPAEPDPEGTDREGMIQDMAHLKGQQSQIGNAVKDLAAAPRNQEGLAEVLELNAANLDELDTLADVKPAKAATHVEAAKAEFESGIAFLAPFAMDQKDFLREMRQELARAANELATLAGDATEEVEPDPDTDTPTVDPTPPPDPAPSPNPLPPP